MHSPGKDTFWQYDARDWFENLSSSPQGLTQEQADQRLREKGIRPGRRSGAGKDVLLFISQFKSPLILLLIGAVIISAFLGERSDVVIILLIILLSGLLSFFQERNAGKVAEKLQSLISIKATVLRDGRAGEIPASRVVAGDVLLLRAGDMLPADCLIMESDELHANESSLTGESYPARKAAGAVEATTPLAARANCLWEGTNIVSGQAKAIVIQTGEDTLFGDLARQASIPLETTFEKGIRDFGFFLIKITMTLAVVILLASLLNHKGIIESSLFALALAVGMAPELLPAITTIAMSRGARRLLEKKVIVKKLNAIQNLGEVDLLCTDKTGTITEGNVVLAGLVDGAGAASDRVKQLAFWNASLESGYTNPIDEALKAMTPVTSARVEKLGEVPYDFIRKRLSIGIAAAHEKLLISKGAFPEIMRICSTISLRERVEPLAAYREKLEAMFAQYGADGLRVIAICFKVIDAEAITKDLEADMVFAGFILFTDPVKPNIIETIRELDKLKVGLKIITGDNQVVARSIARQLGIANPVVMTGTELAALNPDALSHRMKHTHIFSEVEPHQKERIILALKKNYTVAYMGDGINDVSAINAADVGISVNNAVDAAREAADFVLMEKELLVLTEGIREGRKTFANTLKYLYISSGSTLGNMCSVAAASIFLPFLPMLPKQILLTNFLSDFPFLAVSTDNVDPEQIQKPGKWNLKLIRNFMVVFGIHSSIFDLITFLTLYVLLKARESDFQTGWFVESILTELLILFVIRTHKTFTKSRPGKYLFIFGAVALMLTIGLPYLPFAFEIGLTPLPPENLAAMLGIVLAYVITADRLKVWFFRKHRYA